MIRSSFRVWKASAWRRNSQHFLYKIINEFLYSIFPEDNSQVRRITWQNTSIEQRKIILIANWELELDFQALELYL